MPNILYHEPLGRNTAYIGNSHGDTPPLSISNFCGAAVINALLAKLKKNPSGRVYFEKDGAFYRLYGGPNRTKTKGGKYCFHVYKYAQ